MHRVTILAGVAAVALSVPSAYAQTGKPPMPVIPASLKLPAAARRDPVRQDPDAVSLPRDVIAAALSYRGVPYVHGGDTRGGMDCSGLVYRVFFDTTGMELPRGVEGLFHEGTMVGNDPGHEPSQRSGSLVLHVADLVFFDTDSEGPPHVASHVGIYAGGGRFIHAASEGSHTGVIVSSLDNPYYSERFIGARRVVSWRTPALDVFLTDTTRELNTSSPFPSRERMTIRVFNRMSGGGPMDLIVERNGTRVLSARVAPGTFRPSEIPLTPDTGTWTVRISRLFRGREIQSLTFTVEE